MKLNLKIENNSKIFAVVLFTKEIEKLYFLNLQEIKQLEKKIEKLKNFLFSF